MYSVVVDHSFNNPTKDLLRIELLISRYSLCTIICKDLNHFIFLAYFSIHNKIIGKNTEHMATTRKMGNYQKMDVIVTNLKLDMAVLLDW
jgi:cell division FtsZ-interacting protein ZapD